MNRDALPLAVRRHPLVATIRAAISGPGVVVAISGGADSTALLLLCCAAAAQRSAGDLRVVAGHVHHGIRVESDAERTMVQQLCDALDIPCETRQLEGISTASEARNGRYAALTAIAEQCDLPAVLTAHHARDQLETMLIALCRGGGPRTLAGMPQSRPLSDSVQLVRPLLDAAPETLREICEAAGVQWCEDPTNDDPNTPRGLLRRDVLPALVSQWPGAARHAAHGAMMLHSAADAFDAETDRSVAGPLPWSRPEVRAVPRVFLAAALHRHLDGAANFDLLIAIAEAIGDASTEPRTFQFAGGVVRVTAHEVALA